jgi:hypothetical protein
VSVSTGQTIIQNFTVMPPKMVIGTVTGSGGYVFQPPNIAAVAACPADEPFAPGVFGPFGCPGGQGAFADPTNDGAYWLALNPGSYNMAGLEIINPINGQSVVTDPIPVTLAQGDIVTENFVIKMPPVAKDDCKNDGWQQVVDNQGQPFKSQGDCLSFVATGGKNPAAG